MPQLNRSAVVACSIATVLALSACGHNRPDPYYGGGYGGGSQGAAPSYPVNNNPRGTEFGRVSNIEVMQSRGSGQTSGGGAVLGAVVGGLLGNQVGKGSGRAAATAVGVIGGAVAGNAIEGRNSSGDHVDGYRISVQLDHGGYRVYDVGSPGDLRIGDRVRLYNGQISRQ
jgi:outer membrane lipoprotein SlyB